MLKTYKILSILLDYPTEVSVKLLPMIMPALQEEKLLNSKALRNMTSFIESVEKQDLISWQESYSGQFDYATNTSLYLFDHVYGDSKKRGMAMVDLKQLYHSEGLEIASDELPDYLPVFLEFIASSQTDSKGADLLAETQAILERINQSLKNANSCYRFLLDILLYLAAKGTAEQMTLEEKTEMEHMKACEACFFHASDYQKELEEF